MSYVYRGIVLPEHLEASLRRYAQDHRPTGGFLEACISNDLAEAVRRADEISLGAISAVVAWLYNEAPAACWGSHEKAVAWVKMGQGAIQ